MRIRTTDACLAIRAALAESAGTLDARPWGAHLAACQECREDVQLDALLRRGARAARRAAPAPPMDGSQPALLVQRALERRRRGLALRRAAAATVLALAGVGVAVAAWTRPTETVGGDPLAIAAGMLAEVLPAGAPARPERLREDPAFRERCVAALKDGRGVVRRAALTVLALGEVDLETDTLEEVLRTWNEDLESPIEVASTSDAARHVAAALDARRTATLQATLKGAWFQASRGGAAVDARLVESFVASPHAPVRQEALHALSADRAYVPGAAVETVLRDPAEPRATRRAAAECLVERSGEVGMSTVVASLRRAADPALEQELVAMLQRHAAGRAYATERLRDPATPTALALQHAAAMGRGAPAEAAAGLAARAVREGTLEAAAHLVTCCRQAAWEAERATVQDLWRARSAAWRTEDPDGLRRLVRGLLAWDEAARDAARTSLALDICEQVRQDRDPFVTGVLSRIRDGADPALAERAARILER